MVCVCLKRVHLFNEAFKISYNFYEPGLAFLHLALYWEPHSGSIPGPS